MNAPRSLATRAAWVIERNLDRDLSLKELAEACDVSPWHLSHAFSQRAGRSITGYIRSRRLSHAAEALAAGAPDILAVALASGYNSHEAFSRAFKELLGMTPESVRRCGTTAGLPLVGAVDMMSADEVDLPDPEIRMAAAMTFACVFERFALEAMQGIPALWRRFMEVAALIERRVHPIPVGIVGPIRDDGGFDYGCGIQVDAASNTPKQMTLLSVPEQRYALFRHVAHVSMIKGTYDAIWNRVLPENGWTMPDQPSLEWHEPTFDPLTGDGGVTIWVPVISNAGAGGEGHGS
jgi:AraC family transcriptional regulator